MCYYIYRVVYGRISYSIIFAASYVTFLYAQGKREERNTVPEQINHHLSTNVVEGIADINDKLDGMTAGWTISLPDPQSTHRPPGIAGWPFLFRPGMTTYTLHGKEIVHLVNGSNNLHVFYDAQNRPAVVSYNGTCYGYVYNLQGDVIGLIDTSGAYVIKYIYNAWGKPLSKTGSMAATLGTLQPFRYRHYAFDEETGLYYQVNRFFDAWLMRFISADRDKTACYKSAYAYCSNNPTNFVDPLGLDEETFSSVANRYSISEEYYRFLHTIYDYSWKMHKNSEQFSTKPSVYTTTKVMENCVSFAEAGYSYNPYDCAYSIAKQLPNGTTSTGMTRMWGRDAIATISLEKTGGYANLFQGMILVCYDEKREKPAHHGGIYVDQSTVYESTPGLGGFRKSEIHRQKWNKVMWVDGMILSPAQMKVVESILFLVCDEE